MDLSWTDALRYAAGDGIPAVVGAILSIAAEYWPWYQRQEPKPKRLIFFGVCLVLPLLASSLGVLTADWALSWELTFWPAVRAGIVAGGAGTLVHLRKL